VKSYRSAFAVTPWYGRRARRGGWSRLYGREMVLRLDCRLAGAEVDARPATEHGRRVAPENASEGRG